VTIVVEGAPPGARIYFDGAEVHDNPFRARKAPGVVPLRVVAEGFEPYAVSVEPSSDRTVEVALSPAAAEEPAVAAPAAEPPPSAPVQPTRGRETGKRIHKATRGAEFAESFE
jgi:hypothetical protein